MLYEYDISNSIFGCIDFSAKGKCFALFLRLDRNLYLMFIFHDFPAYFIHLKDNSLNQSNAVQLNMQRSCFFFNSVVHCTSCFPFYIQIRFLQGKERTFNAEVRSVRDPETETKLLEEVFFL
jgi:hypothetical protein